MYVSVYRFIRIQVWSAVSGRLKLSLRGHSSVITDLAVSPDNSMLVSSSDDRNVRVWDPRTGASLSVLRGHGAAVNLVNFAPGDSVAISASEDGTCRVWDLRDRARCVVALPFCVFFFSLVGWLVRFCLVPLICVIGWSVR